MYRDRAAGLVGAGPAPRHRAGHPEPEPRPLLRAPHGRAEAPRGPRRGARSRWPRSRPAARSSASPITARSSGHDSATSSPANPPTSPLRSGRRAPMPDTRPTFHHQLDEVQRDLLRAAARVTESIMRGTEALLDARPGRGAGDHRRRRGGRPAHPRRRGALLHDPRAAAADGERHAGGGHRHPAHLGDRAVRRPHGQRRQGRPPAVRQHGASGAPRAAAGMADESVRLFRLAMDAYADGDADLAGALDDMDDRLDELHRDYIQAILEHYADVRDVQAAVQLALVGRYYERIGDHAVNIGERVQYMVTGWLPEHTSAPTAVSPVMLTVLLRGRRARCWPRRSPWCSSARSGSPAGCCTPGAACPTTSCRPGRDWPRPRRSSSARSTAPCSGEARARWPRRAWPARWR